MIDSKEAIKASAWRAFVLFVLFPPEDNTAPATPKPTKLTAASNPTVASTIPGLRIREVLDGLMKVAGSAVLNSG